MRALILAGGAARNSYQIGCLQYLLGNLQIKYDLIIGVSSGAILGSFLGQYSHDQEKQSIDDMTNLWKKITTKDICKSWGIFGRLHAFHKHGLYDSSGIGSIIKSNISLDKIRKSGKTTCVNVVSLSDGKHYTINQNNDNLLEYIVASAAFPGVFPPAQIDNNYYIDGGTKDLVNTQFAIDYGCTSIDIILTSPSTIQNEEKFSLSLFSLIQRVVDISSNKIMNSDLDRILTYKLTQSTTIDKIHLNIIRPNNILMKNSFKWEPKEVEDLIFVGYQDAIQQYKINE